MNVLVGCFAILVCISCPADAQNPGRVVDLRDREFTAEEIKRALVAPKTEAGEAASGSPTAGGGAKVRRLRGLGVVAAGESGAGTTPTAPPPKISMQLPFAFDSADVLESARSRLDALGLALQSQELLGERYIVSGHTDAAGRYEYNVALSKRRAESVKNYLVTKHGIAPDRIVPVGKGPDELVDPTDPRAAVNRRVAIEGMR